MAQIILAQRSLHPIQKFFGDLSVSQQFFGDVSRAAVVATLRELDDRDSRVRSNAIMTLATISKKDEAITTLPEVIAALSRRLTDYELSVRAKNAVLAWVYASEKENPQVIAAVSDRLADEDLSVRADAVRALVYFRSRPRAETEAEAAAEAVRAEENHRRLASTIWERLVVSNGVPYERFFLILPLLFAPGSPIRQVADLERMMERDGEIEGSPPYFPNREMILANGREISLRAYDVNDWSRSTGGCPRMFLNMVNRLFPAELQAAIDEDYAQRAFQTEFLVSVGRIQNVDDLITQIEGAEVAFQEQQVGGLPFYGFSLFGPQQSYETAESLAQIVGTWSHTRGPHAPAYGLDIFIDVFDAGHVEIRFENRNHRRRPVVA